MGLIGTFTLERPTAIAVRRTPANILVTDRFDPSGQIGRITEFSKTAGKNVPTGEVRDTTTGLVTPTGLALDVAQRLYVAEATQPAVLIFSVQGHQVLDEPPGARISGPATARSTSPGGYSRPGPTR